MNRLLIIDGMNLVRRILAAQPDQNDMQALTVRAIAACRKLCQHHQPSHVVVVWDGTQVSWRKQLYPDYKKGRKPMPESLAQGLPSIITELKSKGFNSLQADSEADDVIATLAFKLNQSGGEVIIVSTDKGFAQLNLRAVKQWDYFAHQWLDLDALEQKLGVSRQQLLDFIALSGDSGNKIPGISGIGPKSAAELLRSYRSLANIYNALDKLGSKQAQKLADGREMARLSYKLAKLKTDMTLDVRLSDYRLQQ
ncbi:flap endonuclease Xni [Shewanella avicenniae]|uniref:Flap endonuclease Xni n=1 Tax=Shewanella avicenniae TaxID=2814294 RepID=A0ABX7QP71_9GAMM|nr:flap endonuclease Xni [Shewanella avicenniae]QSX32528.1 flap endonuclease Xni [Shewanella avicenniae]